MLPLQRALALFDQFGCTLVHAKRMASRHNSKGQIFLASGFAAFQQFPVVDIDVRRGTSQRTEQSVFRGSTNFWWLSDDGVPHRSPATKIIMYPQYANGRGEVRLSGFKQGFVNPIGDRLDSTVDGRVLLIGVAPGRRMYGYCASPDSELSNQLLARPEADDFEAGRLVSFPLHGTLADAEQTLRGALAELANLGWQDARRLDPDGVREVPLSAASTNAGGWTIEALLGIAANSRGGGDYLGWEIKSHQTPDGASILASSASTTLMDFSPDGGDVVDMSRGAFFERYGYQNRADVDRLDLYGAFGSTPSSTGKRGWSGRLVVHGFDRDALGGHGALVDPGGALKLINDERLVASWSLCRLLAKWQEKHARAVFVPRDERPGEIQGCKQILVGAEPLYCRGADVLRLLGAIQDGKLVVEPAMSWNTAVQKMRKQRWLFRTKLRDVTALYHQSD